MIENFTVIFNDKDINLHIQTRFKSVRMMLDALEYINDFKEVIQSYQDYGEFDDMVDFYIDECGFYKHYQYFISKDNEYYNINLDIIEGKFELLERLKIIQKVSLYHNLY